MLAKRASDVDEVDNENEILSNFDEVEDDDVQDWDCCVTICELFRLPISGFLLQLLLLLLLADGSVDDKAIFSSLRFRSSDCDNFMLGRSR